MEPVVTISSSRKNVEQEDKGKRISEIETEEENAVRLYST